MDAIMTGGTCFAECEKGAALGEVARIDVFIGCEADAEREDAACEPKTDPSGARGGDGSRAGAGTTVSGEADQGLPGFRDSQRLGRMGEELAAQYMTDHGARVVQRNYRCPFGEADLVCKDGRETVLVEVKTRAGENVFPESAVDAQKLRRYRNITLDYLRGHPDEDQVRFDVIAINVATPHLAKVRHCVGVCSWEG